MNDAVNHPIHYTSHPARCRCGIGVECIEITRHFSFNLGNVIKYLWRAPLKGATLQDLKKARWYLDDAIDQMERESGAAAGLGPRDGGRIGDWIQVAKGRRFWPLDPRPEELDIEIIAHALSLVNRWSGQTTLPMSVAHHSVLVSQHCAPEDALWGLLHDVPEAFLGDVSRPLKYLPWMAPYREAEERFMAVVCDRFGLPRDQPASVTKADNLVLATEARDLFDSLDPEWEERWVKGAEKLAGRIDPWRPEVAEERFLDRFRELTRG